MLHFILILLILVTLLELYLNSFHHICIELDEHIGSAMAEKNEYTGLDEQIGLDMAEKNEYKMEITGGSVAFPMQGGKHTFTNVVAYQTNYGADSKGSKVSEGRPKKWILLFMKLSIDLIQLELRNFRILTISLYFFR